MLKIYGIPNCNTVQKTIIWLKNNNLDFEFHDFKKEGISEKKIKEWLKIVPIETLLNKVSATFKALPIDEKPTSEAEIIALFISKPSCIKRPVLENINTVTVGFKVDVYEKMLL